MFPTVRSVRRFEARPVPDGVVRAILEAGRGCGSSKNGQPWQFLVLTERPTLRSLSVLGPYAGFIAGASLAIIPVMDSGGDRLRAFDCGRVSETMTLAAYALGLGSCVAAIWPEEHQRLAARMLSVPDRYHLWVAIGFGYPTIPVSPRPPTRANRKALSELVHFESFGRREAQFAEGTPNRIGAALGQERGGQ